MKLSFSLLLASVIVFTAPIHARAESYEITTTEEMVNCMQTYIQEWIVAPGTIESWEHAPGYEFAGKYLYASWFSNPFLKWGGLSMMVGPTAVVYCDYPTDASGSPDRTKGFCKATVANADVMFERTDDQNGQEVKSQVQIAFIMDSKLYCENLSRPE